MHPSATTLATVRSSPAISLLAQGFRRGVTGSGSEGRPNAPPAPRPRANPLLTRAGLPITPADADHRLVVVEDCCSDADPEVHRVLRGLRPLSHAASSVI